MLTIRRQWKVYDVIKVIILVGLIASTIALVLIFQRSFVNALGFNWIQSDLVVSSTREGDVSSEQREPCVNKNVFVGNTILEPSEICVYSADGWKYGLMRRWVPSGVSGYFETAMVVSFGDENKMYKVEGLPHPDRILYVPNSDNLIYKVPAPNGRRGHTIEIIRNIPLKLEKKVEGDLSTSYRVKDGARETLLKNQQNQSITVENAEQGAEGKWLLAEVQSGGYVRLNLETGIIKYFSKEVNRYGIGSDPITKFAVSEDGNHVAIASESVYMQPKVYDLTISCGDTASYVKDEWRGPDRGNGMTFCPERNLWESINNFMEQNVKHVTLPYFSTYDGGELTIFVEAAPTTDGTPRSQWLQISPKEYDKQEMVYLALGDSYSSGEGDTEINPVTGKKYYREWTDNELNVAAGRPQEKCHISTRSYPYLLAKDMNLYSSNPRQWGTVACSGARIDDITGKDLAYNGQEGRLMGFDGPVMRSIALNEFIPGRERQIEFVKKYKPKVITIGIGGNDAGFSDMMAICVAELNTCEPFKDQGIIGTKNTIIDLYDRYFNLIQGIQRISPDAKIYTIGYPYFINPEYTALCDANVLFLDYDERKAIHNSITLLNNVIKNASKLMGVKYLDVSGALVGHRLCDSGPKYVTGVSFAGKSEKRESMHPNAKGHQAIYNYIYKNSKSLYEYKNCTDGRVICPDLAVRSENIEIPDFFNDTGDLGTNTKYKRMTDQEVIKTLEVSVKTDKYSFDPNSTVKATLHSDPIHLKDILVGYDGSIDSNIAIPSSTPVGYHTLKLSGKTVSGEDITYEQVVLVKNNDPSDVDGDGISDSLDRCLFIQPSYNDKDQDGIDDACDPEISPTSTIVEPLYRARNGDSKKLEKTIDMYIERNIKTAVANGMAIDYDPDNDGWSVVARISGMGNNGKIANFVIKDKVPYLSVRSDNFGCIRYTPINLGRVIRGKSANAKYDGINTNSCRVAPLDADDDKNGLADNTQPLYRARNGNPGTGEVANSIYLERSRAAAEAQLGISDYAPIVNNVPREWNILARSMSKDSSGVYKELLMLGKRPVIIVTNHPKKCFKIKPFSHNTITKITYILNPLILEPKGNFCG